MQTDRVSKLKRGIYVLPSLFTSANLGSGFLSIIWAAEDNFNFAAWAIIASIAMDMLDGRVARLTRSSSSFGVELDSLADLASFCIAPSFLIYRLVLHNMHGMGIAIAIFFVIAGALRLARYNVKALEGDETPHFVGLPTPAAAGILAGFVLSYELFADSGSVMTVKTIPLLMQKMPFFFKSMPPMMVLLSILMVSNVPYACLKIVKLSRPKSLQLFMLVVIGVLLILAYPQNTIFIIFLLYLLEGLGGLLWRYFRLRRPPISAYGQKLKDCKSEDNQLN